AGAVDLPAGAGFQPAGRRSARCARPAPTLTETATMTPDMLLAHSDQARLWPADAPAPADVAQAYQDALAVRTLRLARGERSVGYKIGFTNRTIWHRYGVYAPVWGTVWNTTLTHCDGSGAVDLAGTCQ